MGSEDEYKTKRNDILRRLNEAKINKDYSAIKTIQKDLSKLGVSGSLKSANKVKKDKT